LVCYYRKTRLDFRLCSGTGTEPPACQLTPPQLDFGSVQVGSTRDLTFTIKNTGGGTLTGSVTESCGAYSIQSGDESYSLAANQEMTVTVRFAPTTTGAQTCTVSLGGTACGSVGCSGTGTESPPVCQLTPSELAFGSVQTAQTKDLTFTIKNTGGGTLTGSVTESCNAYSIQSGDGSYSLAANQEKTVTVRFAPTSAGSQVCTVNLGGTACGSVGCSGVGTGIRIESTFEADEGWGWSGSASLVWSSTGGNPGGCLQGTDSGGDSWYFSAPTKFMGDISLASGGTLSFDLKVTAFTPGLDLVGIVLVGNGKTLVYEFPHPSLIWTSYSAPLTANGKWKLDTLSGAEATQDQIDAALTAVSAISILGDYFDGIETTYLDNVVLASP
jgi:hypothetical protein